MADRQEIVQPGALPEDMRDCPAPISLETIAVIEQGIAELFCDLRERVSARQHKAFTEYDSWFGPTQ
jgi:hypothetical protein